MFLCIYTQHKIFVYIYYILQSRHDLYSSNMYFGAFDACKFYANKCISCASTNSKMYLWLQFVIVIDVYYLQNDNEKINCNNTALNLDIFQDDTTMLDNFVNESCSDSSETVQRRKYRGKNS